jgi:general secretion pathway protein G
MPASRLPNPKHPQASTAHRQAGFTLIEIMVVVVILGILAAIAVPRIMSRPAEARITKARTDIRSLETALSIYKLDNFSYPSNEQGLEALVSKPTTPPEPRNYRVEGYINKLPLDPWQSPYQYLNPGEHGIVDIYSFGPDGQPSDDDIGNWNME